MQFFFYGTLLHGSGNPIAIALHEWLRVEGPATVRGSLYAVPDPEGWYPALVAGDGLVHGTLYRAATGFGNRQLARMDAYEDCDPQNQSVSLYVRQQTSVKFNGSTVQAQLYLFNQPLPEGACAIPEGDFRAWLEANGLKAFGGNRSG